MLEACEFFTLHRLLAFPVVDEGRRLVGVVDVDLYTEELAETGEEGPVGPRRRVPTHRCATDAVAAGPAARRVPRPVPLAPVQHRRRDARRDPRRALPRSTELAARGPGDLHPRRARALGECRDPVGHAHPGQPARDDTDLARSVPAEPPRTDDRPVCSASQRGSSSRLSRRSGRDIAVLFLIVLGGIAIGVTGGAVCGLAIPYILHLMSRDPQVAAGPIALACADVIVLLAYFNLALLLT